MIWTSLLLSAIAATSWQPVENGLVRIEQPSNSDLDAARFGTRNWRVRFKGEVLYASVASSPPPAIPFPPQIDTAELGYYGTQPSEALRVPGGWFLAYDHGEFGGGLWQFNTNGTVGRRLLWTPTYGLLRYGNDVLAETPDNVMYFRNLSLHRFSLRHGSWQEIGHTEFPYGIGGVNRIGRRLYGTVGIGGGINETTALVNLNLAGNITFVWHAPGELRVGGITRSAGGDFALGGTGYVVRLHRTGTDYRATWFAPRDCVTYANTAASDSADARCVGAANVKSYAHLQTISSPTIQGNSRTGNWLILRWSHLLHFSDGAWTAVTAPSATTNYLGVDDVGPDAVLRASDGVWLRREGRWIQIGKYCGTSFSISRSTAWCLNETDGKALLAGMGFDGAQIVARSPHGDPDFLTGGLVDDAWFTEKDATFLGHVANTGSVSEVPLTSPAHSLSRAENAVWFTEADGNHYGFVDAKNNLHEFTLSSQYVQAQSIAGARSGAWLTELLGRRLIVHHVKASGDMEPGNYVADVSTSAVSQDGSIWIQSSVFQTILHLTESGGMTSYRVPCSDGHLRLAFAPNNGIWFLSQEPHCSGLIDVTGIHVRDLPPVEYVRYI